MNVTPTAQKLKLVTPTAYTPKKAAIGVVSGRIAATKKAVISRIRKLVSARIVIHSLSVSSALLPADE